MTDRRFNSAGHLLGWQRGDWPRIHDRIAQLGRECLDGPVLLDLCSSTGILGWRMLQTAPQICEVVGVDVDSAAIARGREHGIDFERLELRIGPDTLDAFAGFCARHVVTSMIARRCLSEVFHGHDPHGWPAVFAARLRDVGIREVLIEGRARVRNPSHDYPTVDHELAPLLRAGWTVDERRRDCVYLV